MDKSTLPSTAFQTFTREAEGHAAAWLEAVEKLGGASSLDARTGELVYLGILAALRLESGIGFHAARAKALGASREDVISAVLAGLPAAGNAVIQSLPPALAAYDGAPEKADTSTG